MAIRPILRMGNPTLRTPAAPYPTDEIAGEGFRSLIEDMRDSLAAAGGIGLAAPQIGVLSQVVIIEIPAGPSRYGALSALGFTVMVNPRVTPLTEATQGYWEGCLSVPGLRGFVERPERVQVDYISDQGKALSTTFEGFPATVVQHELDHLQGQLYIDLISDRSKLSFETEFEQFHQPA
ncbi:MAG: peptide deformylase [Proteobacteria bacterium]|nr:peptide deformylase [Pseudomonadota bacterium]